jgi:peptide/nickel transport system permease protein
VQTEFKNLRRLVFTNALSAFGFFTVAIFLLLALLYWATGGLIAPYRADAFNLATPNLPPSFSHLFGTDFEGRDLFSRVLASLPVDISIPILIVFFSAVIGMILGTIAGYKGGLAEEVIMRLSDMFLAFPSLIMALAIAATLGPSLFNAMIALTFTWWPPYVRLVRGGVLAVKSEDFIATSKALNSSFLYILRKGVLPNILPAILVYATLDVGTALLSLSSLGFLGIGIPAGTPELGEMVSNISADLFTYPWESLLPSIVVLVIVAGFSLCGDGIREASDVKVRPHILLKDRFMGSLGKSNDDGTNETILKS